MSQAGMLGGSGTLARGSAGRSASATHTVGWCGGSVGWTRLQSRYSVTGYKEVVLYIYIHGNAILYFMCRLRLYTQPASHLTSYPDPISSVTYPREPETRARERRGRGSTGEREPQARGSARRLEAPLATNRDGT